MKNKDKTSQNIILEDTIFSLIEELSAHPQDTFDSHKLDLFLRRECKKIGDSSRIISKKRLIPIYLQLKKTNIDKLKSSGWTESLDAKITELLRSKPRRSASGVSTITVLTKPWPCSGNCIFCPNDIRMPKSYIHNEPACQRAERWNFDPFMQVTSRLFALYEMGHNIDKIEIIILGGTFSEYTKDYQLWYIKEIFRALNEFSADSFKEKSIKFDDIHKQTQDQISDFVKKCEEVQKEINQGNLTYNNAFNKIYSNTDNDNEYSTLEEVKKQQQINEGAKHRNVGLVVEIRPDSASTQELMFLRELGCTKIQIGIQTLSNSILSKNTRNMSLSQIEEMIKNMRLLGFKSHVHIMPNLVGATPEKDISSYHKLFNDPAYKPDEVKIYPCCLVESARLNRFYDKGEWQPYKEEELLHVIKKNLEDTPPYARISRLIRDISTTDIIAGNKKPNLRQLIENEFDLSNVQEIRSREIALSEVDYLTLVLNIVSYSTNVSEEKFLQWITPNNKLAGFLRLSLPHQNIDFTNYPINEQEAMIREVHIYGKVAKLHNNSQSAQHLGLGKQLINKACEIARNENYKKINVISAIGTRQYYASLGFEQGKYYQFKDL